MTSHASRRPAHPGRSSSICTWWGTRKLPLTPKLQVEKLKNRGLIVKDELLAEQYLRNISYYRLRAYTYPFQMNEEGKEHVFLQTDISFEDVIELYHFDRRLSSLLFNVIEKIEVAMRTRIALTYSVDTGDGFWFLNDRMYFLHEKFLLWRVTKSLKDAAISENSWKKLSGATKSLSLVTTINTVPLLFLHRGWP